MPKGKFYSFEEAAALIRDGDTLAIGGLENVMIPEKLFSAIEQRFLATGHPRGLTEYHPIIFGMGIGLGLEHFAHEGMVDTAVGSGFSYLKTSRMTAMVLENKLKAHLMPMGTAFRILQNTAAGEKYTLTDVGLHTFVDPRVEGGRMNRVTTESLSSLTNINGEELLCYENPKIDVALIRGTTADENGNISFEEEPVTIGASWIAMAAKACGGKVIVQVRQSAKAGSLHPKSVVIPGIMVDAVVVDEDQSPSGGKLNAAVCGNLRVPMDSIELLELDARKVILSRAAEEIGQAPQTINLGVGLPVSIPKILIEQGRLDGITFFPEHGSVGGVLGDRSIFGTNINPDAIIDSQQVFCYFRGGGLDVAFLGCGQIDREGNVNVSKFNGIIPGCGGFIDITHRTKKLVFCGTFTAGGLEAEITDGGVKIRREGKFCKFVPAVEQITLSGSQALFKRQDVLYVTERAVFRLTPDGIRLIEIAPGADLQKDILSLIPFEIKVDANLIEMDPKHFR